MSKWLGESEKNVAQLFVNARNASEDGQPAIIFIDEIDAIARGRQFSIGGGGQETNTTQNQLLVEMDGLSKGTGSNIIVIGATNAPIESLDEALLRPGRFDRKIMIDRPFADGRNELFKYYLSKVKYDPTLDTMRLANYVIGSSPADIASVVQEAALICTREKRTILEMRDLTAAIERIHLGQERKRKVHPFELRGTAYHESGHAILLYYLHPIDDVFKVSVATRGYTLGVMHHQPIVEMQSRDKIWYEANIVVSLGGYAADKIAFGTTTSGVSSDFEHAMQLAKLMVWRVGMGDSGLVGDFYQMGEHLSADIKTQLGSDVSKILQRCLNQALEILTREKMLMEKMTEKLLEKKTLEYDEVADLCKKYGVGKERKIEELGFLQEFTRLIHAQSSVSETLVPALNTITKPQALTTPQALSNLANPNAFSGT
jgi:cell division protease FtsH